MTPDGGERPECRNAYNPHSSWFSETQTNPPMSLPVSLAARRLGQGMGVGRGAGRPRKLSEFAQPQEGDGVDTGMATVAIDQGGFQGALREKPIASIPADWRQLSDAEIMLRVREGDDAGFGVLIEKYRKPMVHFMFRMVHNQAVAEELAQEEFLPVYRSQQSSELKPSSAPGYTGLPPI